MRIVNCFAVAVIALAGLSAAAPAEAGGDAALAGVAGFAVGTLFGNAVAQPRYIAPVYVAPEPFYLPPPPVIYSPAPVYYAEAPEPWTSDWYAYCASRYRSFDARSGTFVDYDGYRKACR